MSESAYLTYLTALQRRNNIDQAVIKALGQMELWPLPHGARAETLCGPMLVEQVWRVWRLQRLYQSLAAIS